MKTTIASLALTALAALATLQAQADDIIIRNATVITGTDAGTLPSTDVLVHDGRIASVGKNLSAPAGATTIDAQGQVVTAGFFNADTVLGINEIDAIDGSNDTETENTAITAALRVSDAMNPRSVVLPQNRLHGLTHALVMPANGSGLFAGQAAVISTSGDDEMVINPSAAVVMTLGEYGAEIAGGSRAAAMALLRQALDDSLDYAANTSSVNSGNRRDYGLSLMDIKALVPVVKGQKPLIVRIERAADIEKLLALGKQYKLKLILAGVTEGWMVADQIAAAGVPVIVDPINNIPLSFEQIGARLDNAALLYAAGVKMMFTGMGWQNVHNPHLVRQSAGNAVANGLPRDAAIAAITSAPADVFGLDSGRIANGSNASLVVWDGDPLEVTTSVKAVIINGKLLPLNSRALRLRDRYFQHIKEQMK